MSDLEKIEIIRDNRVTRLLWFSIGFISAIIISSFIAVHLKP